jgi:putative ABC transport system permease protein
LAAVISYSLWQRRFAGNLSAVGSPVTLNGQSFTVAGVLPATFRDPRDFGASERTDVWTPIAQHTDRIMNFNAYQVIARLRPGVDLRRAQAEVATFAERLVAADPEHNSGLGARVIPLQESIAEDVRPRLLLLLGAVGFVLLIACANVANLLLARATNRRAEMAVRATLGASRGRLVRLALTESLLLALIGAGLGVVFASWALQLVTPLIPTDVPRTDQIGLDYRLLLFSTALAIVTGVLFGLVPSLRVSRVHLSDTLKQGARSVSAGRNRQRLTHALAIAEIAVALVLLAGGGLMLKSFWRLSHVDPGFRNPHRSRAAHRLLPTTAGGSPDASGSPTSRHYRRSSARRRDPGFALHDRRPAAARQARRGPHRRDKLGERRIFSSAWTAAAARPRVQRSGRDRKAQRGHHQ